MVKRILLLIFLWTCFTPTSATPRVEDKAGNSREKDSLSFVNAQWITTSYHKGGIKLRQAAFSDSSLFNSNQFISVLEISSSFRFDIVADTVLVHTSDFVDYAGALAGINGSFFVWFAPWKSDNYLRIDGKELAPNQTTKEGLRSFRQSGCLGVSPKGRLLIFKVPDHVLPTQDNDLWEKNTASEDLLSSGPVLRMKGKDEPVLHHSFNTTRHPRSAVGIRKGGKVLLVVADGRHKEAAGVSMAELQHIMRWLKAWDAINLDGGGSSTLCVRKTTRDSVEIVNHPSDNKLFDTKGERRVANALVVK
ncbi:MAG: phosphodiester glycosidase family protein [Bacteroidales bacterium]|mgnify:CR=1 FL=1|jgi:exopolysaccharide biosynthesis protein|nr:phosphodiester glycosidase family protein [Bacteroidales bacterium]NLK79641.1 phosphodiester glycosidase family protein [Bacteroidales bacterium]HKM31036.1 phosphodiester glycosidase family protein [Bacteroidales bacterium]HPX80099.1 phosphodiester glycosidase family protein [Bacteroidales bacterium]HQB23281.1 phosphodiester glycosidase family protein [Bacteroidales bacterium]